MNLRQATSLFLTIFLLLCTPDMQSQDHQQPVQLPEGLSLQNDLKYSFDIENKREIFENWLNLDYQTSIFSAGIRYEFFQPNDPNPAVSRGKNRYGDIGFRYIGISLGDANAGGEITAGNFYSLFSRGMVIKIYEDRNLRVDNNLSGMSFKGWYHDFYLKAFSGMAENTSGVKNEILHAADIEYRGYDFLHAGLSYASNQPSSPALARTGMASGRITSSWDNFDIYAEAVIKHNDDIRQIPALNNDRIAGKGFYGNLNLYYESFSVTAEYKLYDNILFASSDGTIIYNTPPGVRKDYSFALLNRHPVPLDQNNEQGFHLDFNIPWSSHNLLNIAWSKTTTLTPDSYYKRLIGSSVASSTGLQELFASTQFDISEHGNILPAIGYMEEDVTKTISITPIVQYIHTTGDFTSLRFSLEHQYVRNRSTSEKYYTDLLTAEFHRSPDIRVSLVSEMETKEPEAGKTIRKFWNFVQFSYRVNEQYRFSILAGSRQAGNICIGGVCRYEPEFRGIELRMFTTL